MFLCEGPGGKLPPYTSGETPDSTALATWQ
jgi:hypothetical protein